MNNFIHALPLIVFTAVMLCWVLFVAVFIFRPTPPAALERKRKSASTVGLTLQGLSYAVIWTFHRPFFAPITSMRPELEIFLGAVAVTLALVSVWMAQAAVQALGKQWSYVARLVEDHQLVTEGPYKIVRHPIYTSMLGLELATGWAVSHWLALLAALIVLASGTFIRVRMEEKLLREAFGKEFEEYARRVPAVIPGWR